MNLFLTDFSNGYHLSSKGIKTFLEMLIDAEKKSQATNNRLKKSLISDTEQHPCIDHINFKNLHIYSIYGKS